MAEVQRAKTRRVAVARTVKWVESSEWRLKFRSISLCLYSWAVERNSRAPNYCAISGFATLVSLCHRSTSNKRALVLYSPLLFCCCSSCLLCLTATRRARLTSNASARVLAAAGPVPHRKPIAAQSEASDRFAPVARLSHARCFSTSRLLLCCTLVQYSAIQ